MYMFKQIHVLLIML